MPRKRTLTLPLPPLARIGRGKNAKLLLENARLRKRAEYLEQKTKALAQLYSVCKRAPKLPLEVAQALHDIGDLADACMVTYSRTYSAEYRNYVLDVCTYYQQYHDVPMAWTARAFGVNPLTVQQWSFRREKGLPQLDGLVPKGERRPVNAHPIDPEIALAIETAAREAEKHKSFADSGLPELAKVVERKDAPEGLASRYTTGTLDLTAQRERAFEAHVHRRRGADPDEVAPRDAPGGEAAGVNLAASRALHAALPPLGSHDPVSSLRIPATAP